MTRLPIPGGDAGNWGVILNDYLAQAHETDGQLKNTGVLAEKYTKPPSGIPASDLEAGVQDVLDTVADHTTELAQHATTLSDHTSTLAQHNTDLTAKASQADLSAVTTRIDGSLKADGTLKNQSVTRAALDASVAAAASAAIPAGMALMSALSEGAVSAAVQVLGDSTGNGDDEWVRLTTELFASKCPGYETRYLSWNDVSARMANAPTTITAPTAPRHVPFSGVSGQTLTWTGDPITGDLDIRVKIEPTVWADSGDQVIACQFPASGKRAWRLGKTVQGWLYFDWSTDGSALQPTVNSPAVSATGPIWVRVTLDVDNGSAQHAVGFFTSTDAATWTQLGSTTTRAGVTSIFSSDGMYELGGRGGTAELFRGKLFEVQIGSGLSDNRYLVTPCLPEHWSGYSGSSPSAVGTPILTVVNASHPGAGLAYLDVLSTLRKMTPNYGQLLAIVSSSHNEGSAKGKVLLTAMASYLAKIRTRLPNVAIMGVTQNPRIAPANNLVSQAQRRIDYIAAAPSLGWTPVDTYAAFLADPRGLAALINAADGLHPSPAGSQVWAEAVQAALGID